MIAGAFGRVTRALATLRSRLPRLQFRAERFGGIVHLTWPRALVFVSRKMARRLGQDSPLWDDGPDDGQVGLLSAPLEAHLQLTNKCSVGCQGCYTAATPTGAAGEWGLAEWKRAIDALASRGVFHLALGGGESAELPWLPEIARHARARGMVPNLTTSGLLDAIAMRRLVEHADLFGQINVSLDGVGDRYAAVRGVDGFARADAALIALRRVNRHVGINCVVTRHNFDALGELFAYAKQRRLAEIELLRLKPSGRGRRVYESLRCTDAQHRALLPTVLQLSMRHRMRVRLDCSYTPMVTHHKVDQRLMKWLSIYGCAGGDMLVASKADGRLTACSFAEPPETASSEKAPRVDDLPAYWDRDDAFGPFRRWADAAEQPCRSCEYLALCRGGCRVVSVHTAGSLAAPDPECPRVVDYRATRSTEPPDASRFHLPLASG